MFKSFCLLVVFGFFILNIHTYELDFDSIKLLNGSNILERHNISVHRTRGKIGVTFSLYATIETTVELNDDYQVDIMFYKKRFANGRYRRTNMTMPRDSLCNAATMYLVPMFPASKRNTSNLVEPEIFCPLKKVRMHFFNVKKLNIFFLFHLFTGIFSYRVDIGLKIMFSIAFFLQISLLDSGNWKSTSTTTMSKRWSFMYSSKRCLHKNRSKSDTH